MARRHAWLRPCSENASTLRFAPEGVFELDFESFLLWYSQGAKFLGGLQPQGRGFSEDSVATYL